MTAIPLQLNTITIKDASLAEKFSLAAACGFGGLEMWAHEAAPHLLTEADWQETRQRYQTERTDEFASRSAMDSVGRLTNQHGLGVKGLIPGADVLVRWHDSLDDDMLQAIEGTLIACKELGGSYMVLPVLGEGGSVKGTAEILKRIGARATPHGIRLGLEPMGHIQKCSRVPDALEALELSGLGQSGGLVMDCFHFFRAEQDVSAISDIRGDQIVMVHVNDAMDLPIDQLFGHKHRVFPGHGIFDVVGFCRAILDTGYVGPFTTEILNPSYWNDDAERVCSTAYETTRSAVSNARREVRN